MSNTENRTPPSGGSGVTQNDRWAYIDPVKVLDSIEDFEKRIAFLEQEKEPSHEILELRARLAVSEDYARKLEAINDKLQDKNTVLNLQLQSARNLVESADNRAARWKKALEESMAECQGHDGKCIYRHYNDLWYEIIGAIKEVNGNVLPDHPDETTGQWAVRFIRERCAKQESNS